MLHYEPVLHFTEEELTEEIEGCCPLLCRRWMLQMQRTEGKTDHNKVLKEFLRAGDAGTMFPYFASLVMILMATPSTTTPTWSWCVLQEEINFLQKM